MTITYCFDPDKYFLRINYFVGKCVDSCPLGYYASGKKCFLCPKYFNPFIEAACQTYY